MAGNTIAKGSVVLTANADGVAPGLKKTEGMLKGWGSKVGGMVSGGMGGGLTGGLMMAGPWGAALAAGVSAASGLIEKFGTLSEEIDAASKSSRALGMDMGDLQGLQHVAKLSGVSIEELDVGLGKFRRQVDGPLDQALYSFADRLEGIQDPGERARLLVEKFGKSGLKLNAMFEGGAEGLKAGMGQATAFGLAMTKAQGQAVEAANDAITNVGEAGKGLLNTVLIGAAPAVEKIGTVLTNLTVGLRPAMEWYGRLQGQVWTIAEAAWNAIGNAISEVADWVTKVGGEMFGWVGTMPTIEEVVVGLFRAVGTSAAYTWDVVKIGVGAIALVAGKFIEAGGGITSVFRGIVDMMKELPDSMKFPGFDKFAAGVAQTDEVVKRLGGEMAAWGKGAVDVNGIGKSAKEFNALLDKALVKKDKLDDPKPLVEGLSKAPMKFAAAIEAGSKEAYSMEVRNKFGDKAGGGDPVVGALKANGKKQDDGNKKLDKIEKRLAELESF